MGAIKHRLRRKFRGLAGFSCRDRVGEGTRTEFAFPGKVRTLWSLTLRGAHRTGMLVSDQRERQCELRAVARARSRAVPLLGRKVAYQYVRERLTQEDADKLANACRSTQEKLIIWPLLDCGLRVSELCGITPQQIQWQQRCLRIKGKGGPFGKRSKNRVVPMWARVRAVFEPYFALHDKFPVGHDRFRRRSR